MTTVRRAIRARKVACAVASAWLFAGCAAAQRSEAPAASGASAGSQAESASGGAATAGASTATSSGGTDTTGATSAPVAGSSRPMTVPPPSVAGGAGGSGGGSGRSLAEWEADLDQGMRQLSSAGSECRDVCRACGGICVAAREICSLTGDGEGAPPSDGRCARARSACERATRQRNGACPVCPADAR